MRRRLSLVQDKDKALEVRLEGEIGEYYVIVEGLTVKHRAIYINGVTDTSFEGYFEVENNFFEFTTYFNYNEAIKAFKEAMDKYLGKEYEN